MGSSIYNLGCSHSVSSFPQYIGTRWTVGIPAWGVVQFGMFPLCPFLSLVVGTGWTVGIQAWGMVQFARGWLRGPPLCHLPKVGIGWANVLYLPLLV